MSVIKSRRELRPLIRWQDLDQAAPEMLRAADTFHSSPLLKEVKNVGEVEILFLHSIGKQGVGAKTLNTMVGASGAI